MAHKKIIRINPLEKAFAPGGVDSHAHLDSKEFDNNRDEIIKRAFQVGLSQIVNVFLSPEDFEQHEQYFAEYPEIFFILGIHPSDGNKCTSTCMSKIENLFKHEERLKAVGEIGLDYHWDTCPREIQMDIFARQLEMARNISKPVVIHCRDAEDDCLTLLEAGGFKDYPLLWHCFGGDSKMAKRIIHNGWHISIPGSVTYPSNKELRDAVSIIPDDKLLLETDCPYLPPVPWRGTCNEPAYIVFTARTVAEARNQDPDVLWQLCGDNTRRFFNLI